MLIALRLGILRDRNVTRQVFHNVGRTKQLNAIALGFDSLLSPWYDPIVSHS